MLEYIVEMLITAFTFGGIIGAAIALHLSSNLQNTENAHHPRAASHRWLCGTQTNINEYRFALCRR